MHRRRLDLASIALVMHLEAMRVEAGVKSYLSSTLNQLIIELTDNFITNPSDPARDKASHSNSL